MEFLLAGEGSSAEGDQNRAARIRAAREERRSRRMKRVAAVFAIGLAPIVVLGWAGCSDKNTSASGATPAVDPGGTFGAEISINVVGRGRVMTSIPGVDCPSDCFAKYVFASSTAVGADKGVGLKAIATPGSTFLGWSFEAEQIGSRGLGPDNCNPVLRAGAQPSINASAEEITLPFGETTGTSPKGQEGACAGYTRVPVVYKVTATFSNPTVIDAGDDSGGDGGTGEVVFNTPQVGAIGREIGFSGSYLYWMWQTPGGLNGISYSTNPTTSVIPTNGNQLVTPTQTINVFEIDTYGVAYQTSGGTVYISRSGSFPTQMNGVAPTCAALAVDSSYNVYCRSTTGSLVQWVSSSYTTQNVLFTGIPAGNDLLVESSFGAAYFSTPSAISSLPLSPTPDGGVASPTTVISGRFSPANLESNTSHFWWTETNDSFYSSSSKSVSSIAYDTSVPFMTGLSHLAPDQQNSSYFWVASANAIYHAYYSGGLQTKLFKSGLSGIGGIAADYQYVYWTQSDGTVHRAPATQF